MKAHKNTITFNGRTYDATTGKAIKGLTPVVSKAESLAKPQVATTSQSSKHSKPVSIPVRVDVHRSSGQGATQIHVKTERTKTLMRQSVKKPATNSTNKGHTNGLVTQPKPIVINGTDRQQRAIHSLQSKHISKFAPTESHTILRKTAEIPVASAPARQKESRQRQYNIQDTPPTLDHFVAARNIARPNIFEAALSSATTHQAKKRPSQKELHKRGTRLSAGLATIALLAGFYTYQNIPRLALARASSQIGFSAQVPNFHPAGFAQSGPIQYQRGLVVMNFRSNSDDRTYTVTQAKTQQPPANLGNDYLAKQGKDYETAQADGRQVFIYNGSNATWIKDGVWYTVEGNADLSRNQLLNIASSI